MLIVCLMKSKDGYPKMDFSTKPHIYDASCHSLYFCVLIITTGDLKMQRIRKMEQYVITKIKKNKLDQMSERHIHGLSSYVCPKPIYLKANYKSIDVYFPLLNLNGMIRKKQHIYVMH